MDGDRVTGRHAWFLPAAPDRKRELREALTVAFTTPLEPEDLFELSRGLDRVLIADADLREVAERVRYSVLKQR